MPSITSSGTRAPELIYSLALIPRDVCLVTCSRSISPVEIWGISNFSIKNLACVPFPPPGGLIIIFSFCILYINKPAIVAVNHEARAPPIIALVTTLAKSFFYLEQLHQCPQAVFLLMQS